MQYWMEYLAQHIILSTTLTKHGMKIKGIMLAKEIMEMWKVMEVDAKLKSTLFILDTKSHENLMKMGSEILYAKFSTVVMLSPPKSCHPMLQAITTAETKQAVGESEECHFSSKKIPHQGSRPFIPATPQAPYGRQEIPKPHREKS